MLKKYFNEDKKLDYLERLMNRKSNLLLNLDNFKGKQKKKMCLDTAILELEIFEELRIKKDINKNSKKIFMHNSLISSINLLIDFFPKKAYNIALKALGDDLIDKKKKRIFFKIIDEVGHEKKATFSYNFWFFNYLVKLYIERGFEVNYQNLNKCEYFILNKLDYPEIILTEIEQHSRAISRFPLFSYDLDKYLKSIIKMRIISEKNNLFYPSKNYKIAETQANYFLKRTNNKLLNKIDKIILEFMEYSSDMINKWEKGLEIMNFFETKENF